VKLYQTATAGSGNCCCFL